MEQWIHDNEILLRARCHRRRKIRGSGSVTVAPVPCIRDRYRDGTIAIAGPSSCSAQSGALRPEPAITARCAGLNASRSSRRRTARWHLSTMAIRNSCRNQMTADLYGPSCRFWTWESHECLMWFRLFLSFGKHHHRCPPQPCRDPSASLPPAAGSIYLSYTAKHEPFARSFKPSRCQRV